MSKHQVNHNVQFAASAASCFKPEGDFRVLSNHVSVAASRKSRNGLLTVAAIFLCGLAVPASAQNPAVPEIAPEQAFTMPPNLQTPMVLQTQPDAACDLHPMGVNDASHTMRLYANAEGYVRVHVKSQESAEDERMQLDCAAGGNVTTYPLRLHAGFSPTEDMPAPRTAVPAPKDAKVLPALTEETAQQFSAQYLFSLGYPPRPDATASPDDYKRWLDMVSRPITLLPPHLVSHSHISHTPRGVEAGPEKAPNWSGLEAHATTQSYMGVKGEWAVPFIVPSTTSTHSAFWVGLDGDCLADLNACNDLVQAGTEQDSLVSGSTSVSQNFAWTEILPTQPTEVLVTGLSINPGDDMLVIVTICDSIGTIEPDGKHAWFYISDKTTGQAVSGPAVPFGTKFAGLEAEWIMERPCLSKCGTGTPVFAELAEYLLANMANAYALPTKGAWTPSSTAANLTLTMYNGKNELSFVSPVLPNAMTFFWLKSH